MGVDKEEQLRLYLTQLLAKGLAIVARLSEGLVGRRVAPQRKSVSLIQTHTEATARREGQCFDGEKQDWDRYRVFRNAGVLNPVAAPVGAQTVTSSDDCPGA